MSAGAAKGIPREHEGLNIIMRKWSRQIFAFSVYCLLAGNFQTAVLASETETPHSGRKWSGRTVRLLISESLRRQTSAIKAGTDFDAAAESAAITWENAADIDLDFADSSLENISNSRSGGDGSSLITVAATSENLALFPQLERSAPAYTRLFFDRRGAIVEADIVLNPYLQFSSDGTAGTFDLQSVLTHEFGHVIGLAHSPVASATMFGRLSPNLERSAKGIENRTLALADVSAARAVYGPRGGATECCAAVLGTLSGPIGTSGVVWVEEAGSGRLVAASELGDGSFDLAGFAPGKYRLFAQGARSRGASQIFERDLDLPTSVRRTVAAAPIDAEIKYIGINGELGALSVNVTRGNSHQIYIGGTGLDRSKLTFGVSGPHISVSEGSVLPMNYGRGISVVVLTIVVGPDIPAGEYSVFAEAANGARSYLLGAISVD